MMARKRVLLTGSSGMIGTRLYERLSPAYEIIGVDIKPNKWLPRINENTVQMDLRAIDEFETLPRDVSTIIHLAANARVYELVKAPELALDNILMTFNVLEFARKHHVENIIFSSSRETYGNIEMDAVSEDAMRVENCESSYSASKITGEAMVHAYQRAYGIKGIVVRFSNVYGMYDDSDRVIPVWLSSCSRNEEIVIFGKHKTLDFTYIDDAVDGIVRVLENIETVPGHVFNIASGTSSYLLDVAHSIISLLGSESKISVEDNRLGEVWHFRADISKARELIGYSPKTTLEEGLCRTIEWYRNNGFMQSLSI